MGLMALSLTSCSEPPRAQQGGPLPVQTEPAQLATFRTSVETVSSLEALDLVQLSAQEDGRIVNILVSQGSQVQQGDLLLVLDQEQQKADVVNLRAKAATDQLNYERYESLVRQGAASQIQRDQFRQEAIASREALNAREADRRYRNIRAPISGIVADLQVKQGDVIESGDPFTKIVSNDRLMVRIEVPSVYAERVRIGQSVLLSDPATDRPLASGQVESIDPVVGDSQTLLAKAEFDNRGGRLRNGVKVRTQLVLEQSQQLSVPFKAVQQLAGQSFVFIPGSLAQLRANPDRADLAALAQLPATTRVALQRPVVLGPLQNDRFPVLSGLSPGEAVITSNLINLRHGLPIKPRP
ncbi:Multidrug resistance protein MdtA [Synechococcus sp. CBW1107]|nr:Multidrug resistance protein MdtA [Synechococcus sp. CBW1107]